MDDDLVGVAEIARRAGVAWSTVQSWRRRHPDFPAPVADLAMGPVWQWGDVARWTARERRSGRPRKAEATHSSDREVPLHD